MSDSSIQSTSKSRYFRGDTVVVKGGESHDILIYDAANVPNGVLTNDHYEIIHAPEKWGKDD